MTNNATAAVVLVEACIALQEKIRVRRGRTESDFGILSSLARSFGVHGHAGRVSEQTVECMYVVSHGVKLQMVVKGRLARD